MSVRLCSVSECGSDRRSLIPVWSAALAVLIGFWFAFVPSVAAQTSLPGTIQAEDFDNGASSVAYWDSTGGNSGGQYRSTNVDIEGCSEGGYDVGWAYPGEWLNYTVSLPSSGTYTVAFRVATGSGGSLHLEINGQNVSGSFNVSPTGGWQSWTTVQKSVSLSGGTQVMRIVFDSGYVNVNWFSVSSGSSGSGSGSAKAIPGTIQAEDFDAYYDTTSGNSGGQYRSTDVDIEGSTEGGYDIGWSAAGEWLNYTVNVAAAGTYTLDLRVATASSGSLHVTFNGTDVTGTVSVSNTGGWQSWTTIRQDVNLSAGAQAMRVVFDSGNINLNYVAFTAGSSGSGSSGSGSSGSSSPFAGVPLAIPGWVQAEDFDNGGQGVGYSDNTPGNAGGVYRATDVDIDRTSAGGYAVGWATAGEWLRYTVNVASAGTYTLTLRVASAGYGGTFHIEFDNGATTDSLRIQDTGGWQNYQDLATTMSLAAGTQSMWLVFDSNGSSGAVGNISAVRFDYGSAAAPSPAPSPSPSPSGGGRLRMMTWNINFGHGNPSGQAQLIASSGADVATLQEASTYDENMPSTYVSRLQQLTGQTWYSAWGPSLTSGASQGTLILSRYPIVDATPTVLYGTGTVRAAINVGGVIVQIFSAHLEYYDTSKRTQQLYALLDWSRGFSGPRIVGGDFNSWWGEWWISQMKSEYSDTWQVVTGSVENGYTLNGAVRFDYLFRSYTDQNRATPTNCWVQSTTLSDHWPVIADYNIQ
jgi:endonuclease/exonuclease/phosphatase family metal-dependent hydrolase